MGHMLVGRGMEDHLEAVPLEDSGDPAERSSNRGMHVDDIESLLSHQSVESKEGLEIRERHNPSSDRYCMNSVAFVLEVFKMAPVRTGDMYFVAFVPQKIYQR